MKTLFATNFEQYFSVLMMIDLVTRFLEIQAAAKFVFYCVAVLVMASMIRPSLRNPYMISVFLYLLIFVPNLALDFFEYEFVYMQSISGVLYLLIGFLIVVEGPYYVIEPSGPYGVGRRDKIIKKDDGYSLTLSVFYPTDRDYYNQNVHDKSMTSVYYASGHAGLDAISKVNGVPSWLLYQTLAFRVRAVNDAKLHKDFTDDHKKLTPVICSHGLMGHRNMLASHVLEMASYGCIVYCCDHTDKSAGCFLDHTKNPPKEVPYIEFNEEEHKMTQEEYRQQQLDHRVNKDIGSMVELVKEEAQPDYLPCIDISKLCAFGHSMGGMTAVHMAHTFPDDFKLCMAMDIYFKAMYKKILKSDDYFITQPLCISTSETFHDSEKEEGKYKYKAGYDSKKVTEKFYRDTVYKNGSKTNYNLLIPDSSHICQIDSCILLHKDMKRAGAMPKTINPEDKYREFIAINLAFMDEHGFLPVKYGKKVRDVVTCKVE